MIGLFGAAAFAPSAAFAACAPASGDNVTVTCSGATLDQGPGINTGYGDGTQNGLTINVVGGPPPASVAGTSTGIDVGSNNTINNFGTITTAGNGLIGDVWGINANGTNLTVNNSGTIGRLDIPDNLIDAAGISAFGGLAVTNNFGATIQGATGIEGAGAGTVVNSGLIIGGGGGNGIDFTGTPSLLTVTNNASGVITGDANGINADSSVVYNYGTISGAGLGGTGVNSNTLVLTNYASGLITGDGFGVSGSIANLTITNLGTISATGLFGTGVEGNVVNITNSGTISATSGGNALAGISMVSGSVTNNSGGVITGDGVAILSSGNTTVFNAGTLTGSGGAAILFFGGGNTLTLGPGSVINGTAQGFGADTFQLGGTGADTFNVNLFATQFSGYSTFNKIDASTWALTGTTAAVTPWTINQGTLAISSDGSLGAASGALTFTGGTLETTATFSLTHAINLGVAGGTISTDTGTTLTATGTITGANGALTKIGAGTLLLGGNNTYGGGTTISAGTLQLGVDSVFNVVGQPSSGIVSSAIGKGTLTFDGGTLQSLPLSERAIANAIQITANGGTIDSASGFFRITGDITDAPGSSGGRLTFESIAGAGLREVALSGNDTYSGITYIDSGTVIANSTTALSLNSAFEVNTGATLTLSSFSNSIASLADGNAGGGVVQNASSSGTATLTITGASGATTSFSGVLRDGTGGEGGVSGPILAIVKDGPGTQILAGINQYTGTTTVNGGVLEIDGSIAPSRLTTVNAGATLSGSGTVGNTAITGGTLAPGSTGGGIFGPLSVQGNLSFTAASTYMIQVSPANAGRTNVTGGATLGGATVNAVFLPGSYVSKQYTIVNATGGLGGTTFNPTVVSNMSNLQSTLSYDANDAYLNVKLNFTPPSGNLNVNQQNVANALTGFFNRTGGIPAAFAALSPAGLTQASGEVATGSQQTTFDAMTLFMGLLTDPFIAGRGEGVNGGAGATPFAEADNGANAYAANGKARTKSERDAYAAIYTKAPPAADPFAQRWSVWAAGYGGSQTTDGNATLGSNTATSSIAGTAVGADYRFSPFTLAGFALAGGATNFSLANGLGSGRSDLFQAGAFVRHTVGPAYISAALAYGWQDITTDRTVTIAGADQLRAQFNANAYSGRVEGGYRFVTPWMGGVGLTPYAAGQFTTFDLPAYAEQALSGANTFALAYNSQSVTDTRSELGLRTDKSYAVQDGIFTLRGRFAWAHDYNPDRNIAATFQTLPGASFVVNGAAQAHDSALTTASAEMKWTNGWSAAATFEGEFSEVTQSYAGKGVVRYAW